MITMATLIKIVDKTIFQDRTVFQDPASQPSAFWSGWTAEPTYTAEGTSTFSTEGDVLKLAPRSGITSFNSSYQYVGGSLDGSNCTSLTTLNCYGNLLTALNVSGCTSLATLNCNYNNISSLDVSSCANLTTLNCYYNQLTTLDVSGLTSLSILYCGYQSTLTSLNVSGCTSLTTLIAHNSSLTQAAVDQILADMVANNNTTEGNLIVLGGGTNAIPSSAGLANKAILQSRGFSIIVNQEQPSAFWSGWTSLPAYTAEGTATFSTTGNILKLAPRNGLTTFNSAYTYKGGSIDASGCTNLSALYCNASQLTSLNVSGLTTLSTLYCYNNQLTTLNVSGLTSLSYLYCSENLLATLDVSSLTNLATLYCYTNQLTTLNVSGLTNLLAINCSNNSLTEAAVNNILIAVNGFGTSNGNLNLSGGTNAVPTGAGLTAKAALQSRGWTVITNN